jgi:formylglycine-generating enzyme required for sulfatase activity
MICNKCNFQNEDTAKFCRNCGVKLNYQQPVQQSGLTCPKCNFDNAANMQYCGRCGAALNAKKGVKRKKSVGKYILIAVGAVVFVALLVFGIALLYEWQEQAEYEREQAKEEQERDRIVQNIEMIKVPGGTFTMGCIDGRDGDCYAMETPAHKVTVSSFNIGKYEVTQAQWKAVMGDNPSQFKGDNLPVVNVSWDDVRRFISHLNEQTGKLYRLPTEAEWEFAARGGKSSKGYMYSGSNTLNDVAWYADNSGEKIHPVGTKSPNELGIYDMSGNVWEWCSDWYGSYDSNAQTNPTGPSSGSDRVQRGGGWFNHAVICRSANRGSNSPGYRFINVGFRVVLP